MKLGSALAFIALSAMVPTIPATAAKNDKLPRCTGKRLRPANPYGTVLPTIPDRGLTPVELGASGGVPRGTPSPGGASTTPDASPTNLFPAPTGAPKSGPTSSLGKVPAIGALGSSPTARAATSTFYASC